MKKNTFIDLQNRGYKHTITFDEFLGGAISDVLADSW